MPYLAYCPDCEHLLAMFFAPLLFLIAMAILFPKVTRFLLGLCFFAVLFMISSVIDHAHAAGNESMINNAVAFSNCARGNALSAPGQLHKLKMMGGDEASALAMSCGVLVNSYVHFCQEAGYAEDHCYGDLKFMATDALKQIGD